MEDSLIHLIRQSTVINDSRSLKEFICLQSKASLNIDENTLHCLQSIVRDRTNKLNNRVQCVLSFIKYFYEQNLNKDIWDKFANEFAELCVMCLNECVAFNTKYDEVENVLVYLSEIVSELLKQSEFIVKTIHHLMVPQLIRNITTENFSFEAKCSLVRTLSYIVKCSTKDDHSKINPLFQKDIANFANWIFMCGDFETQTIILEILLYFLSGFNDQEEFCAEWFNLYPRIKTDFCNRDFSDFEPESRLFLNLVNKLNKKPQVYSLGCICVFYDGTKLQKPNDSNYLLFWVDFNIHSESVCIYYQGTDEMWEIFQLHKKNVSEVCSNSSEYNLNNRMTPIVKLCFNFSCGTTDLIAKYLEIWFEISEDFHNLENSFLIPVYGFRYACNWKASMSNSILSNEVMSSEINHSIDRNVCLRKYTPLSVVITPKKSTLSHERSQNLESLQTIVKQHELDSSVSRPVAITPIKSTLPHERSQSLEFLQTIVKQPELDSSVSRQSEHGEILESNHNIMESDAVNFDESSCDEIISTPDVAPVKKPKKELPNLQVNKTNVSSSRYYHSSYRGGKKKQIIQSFSNDKNKKEVSQDNHDNEIKTHKQLVQKINEKEVSPEIHNKENGINIKSTTSSPKTRNEKRVNLKTCDKKNEKNKYSDVHLLKNTNKSVRENQLKNNGDSIKRRKLYHAPENYEEFSLNSPLYNSNQKSTEQNENQLMTDRSVNVMPKVTYSYRTYKQTKFSSGDNMDFENETEFSINRQEWNMNKVTTKTMSPKAQSTGNKKFFTNEQSAAIALSLYQTPKAFNNKTKSVYSDFSSETIKPVKKTYSKPRDFKKKQRERKTVLQIASSDSDPNFVPAKSKPTTRSKKKYPIESYVSRLEQNIDPLRFKNEESNKSHLHICELPVKTVTKQKEIGNHIFTVFDDAKKNVLPTENLYIQQEEIPDNDPNSPFVANTILTTQNKDSSKKLKLNPFIKKPLKSKRQCKQKNMQLPFKNDNQNECNEQNVNEFSSDHEVQNMEISTVLNPAMLINVTKFDADCFSPKPEKKEGKVYQTRKKEKALLLKEEHLSKFGKTILKNILRNIEESKIIIKNEKEDTYAKFISDMEALKKSTASISVELDKCKKLLDKTNNEIEKTIKNFAKCTSNHISKYFALVAKCPKDFESEMAEFAKVYIENTKK